jgi:hypothetical protein
VYKGKERGQGGANRRLIVQTWRGKRDDDDAGDKLEKMAGNTNDLGGVLGRQAFSFAVPSAFVLEGRERSESPVIMHLRLFVHGQHPSG